MGKKMPPRRFLGKGGVTGSKHSVATTSWKGDQASGQERGLRMLRCHCKDLAVIQLTSHHRVPQARNSSFNIKFVSPSSFSRKLETEPAPAFGL